MSLTSILKHKAFQELRTKLKDNFPKPDFDLNGDLLAPPRTKNYGGIGTAFDYLLRFYLEYKYPKAATNGWVADRGFSNVKLLSKESTRKFYFEGKPLEAKEFRDKVSDQLDEARQHHEAFLKTGNFTDKLLRSSLLLSQLDVVFRAGRLDPNFGIYNSEDVEDLKALIRLINPEDFAAKKKCYLNPTFGDGSILVGGADADLILDDLLIDIKVTKQLKLERDHFNQLIGYYILSLIGGVSTSKRVTPIKRVGVYFARYGQLWTVPIEDLGDKKKFDDFKEWFVQYVNENRFAEIDD
jgi:hypothetical protein